MNYHLFYAFLLITFVLVIVPGPIVTLIIATGATRGIRSALMTVLGSTIGNALLLACIALGLNWILRTSAEVFDFGRDGRGHGRRLGDCCRCEPQTVPEADTGTIARPPVGRGADWRRRVAVVGPTLGIAGGAGLRNSGLEQEPAWDARA